MCLIFISLHQHPKYKLIVAANRDEFYQRKTEAAHWWKDHPHILGGRDLEAQGTWMGITRSGKVSMITNYRDPQHINPQAPSRGQLVSDFLAGREGALPYLHQVEKSAHLYNGFNLITGNVNELFYLSNYKKGIDRIADGFHGLSNHLLNTPWPKVERGKEKLRTILEQPSIIIDSLFEAMYDEQIAVDNQLPATGLPLERERALSSMFIKTPNYGSRCSTVIMVDHQDHVLFAERIFNLETFESKTQAFEFKLE